MALPTVTHQGASVVARLPVTPPGMGPLPDLEAGDVLLVRSGSGMGRVIRALDRSEFNHSAVYAGDGRFLHVLPPPAMRGTCVVDHDWDGFVDAVAPTVIEVRRPRPQLRAAIVAGARQQFAAEPTFSYNDLIVLATVQDTSDRLAKALAPVGAFLDDQAEWERLLAA
ncbi:MAG: hypothetical protein AAGK32_12250, partial [Actinomycetota bacterium]